MPPIQAPGRTTTAVRGVGQRSRADVRSTIDATFVPEQLRVENPRSAS